MGTGRRPLPVARPEHKQHGAQCTLGNPIIRAATRRIADTDGMTTLTARYAGRT
jgi:hypothetical protein